jgi:hypothetical protein
MTVLVVDAAGPAVDAVLPPAVGGGETADVVDAVVEVAVVLEEDGQAIGVGGELDAAVDLAARAPTANRGWRDGVHADVHRLRRARPPPLPLRTVTEPLELRSPEGNVPRTCIRCLLSGGGPFDEAAARAQREGWSYHELQSGHHPMQDIPDQLTALLLRIAGATV